MLEESKAPDLADIAIIEEEDSIDYVTSDEEDQIDTQSVVESTHRKYLDSVNSLAMYTKCFELVRKEGEVTRQHSGLGPTEEGHPDYQSVRAFRLPTLPVGPRVEGLHRQTQVHVTAASALVQAGETPFPPARLGPLAVYCSLVNFRLDQNISNSLRVSLKKYRNQGISKAIFNSEERLHLALYIDHIVAFEESLDSSLK